MKRRICFFVVEYFTCWMTRKCAWSDSTPTAASAPSRRSPASRQRRRTPRRRERPPEPTV